MDFLKNFKFCRYFGNFRPLFFKKTAGFTLIELLVVIAIIGILISITVSQMNASTRRAQAAAVKTYMHNLQTEAQNVYINSGTYDALICAADNGNLIATGNIGALRTQIEKNGGVLKCVDAATAFAVSSSIPTFNISYWCVDSLGNSKNIGAAPIANGVTVCP